MAKQSVAIYSGFCAQLETLKFLKLTLRTHGNTRKALMNQLSMWSGSSSATQIRMCSSFPEGYQDTVALTLSCFPPVCPKGAHGKYTTVLLRRMLMFRCCLHHLLPSLKDTAAVSHHHEAHLCWTCHQNSAAILLLRGEQIQHHLGS